MSQIVKGVKLSKLAIVKVDLEKERIRAEISDGRIISIPMSWFPRLSSADQDQLKNFQISPAGYGIHWPDLDEDISIKSFVS
jgi:hypothetical protein